MTTFEGACHCGAIGFAYRTQLGPNEWPVRACQCSFCRAHASSTTSDPAGSLEFFERDAGAMNRYRFGRRTADFLLCRHCGVYVGAVIDSDGGRFGIVNVNALKIRPVELPAALAVDHGNESADQRIARRQLRWTPVVGTSAAGTMSRLSSLCIALAPILLSTAAAAAETWTLELFGGSAYNFRSHLEVEQDGGYSRTLDASYDTRGFRAPLYWMLRGARWDGDRGWEVALLHHKLYLTNPPAGVSSLSVSHGFNILSANRAFRSGNWTYRFGGGAVVTHAEGRINGVSYDGSYKLAGIALLAGGGRRFHLGKSTFLSLEAMLTAAYARPKMTGPPDARISLNNIAIHGLAGIGYVF